MFFFFFFAPLICRLIIGEMINSCLNCLLTLETGPLQRIGPNWTLGLENRCLQRYGCFALAQTHTLALHHSASFQYPLRGCVGTGCAKVVWHNLQLRDKLEDYSCFSDKQIFLWCTLWKHDQNRLPASYPPSENLSPRLGEARVHLGMCATVFQSQGVTHHRVAIPDNDGKLIPGASMTEWLSQVPGHLGLCGGKK